MEIKHVAICGMGALGMLYGKHIAEHDGADRMHYVMDRERLEDYRKRTFSVNDVPCHNIPNAFSSIALPPFSDYNRNMSTDLFAVLVYIGSIFRV
mgnify:CR=1 FL=1